MHCIFDLDHTLIDSSHRKVTLPDGSLDLDHWIENCTAEKIAADGLLPLVNLYRRLRTRGHEMIICTARVMSEYDYLFLLENDIVFDVMLDRPQGCRTNDADLKEIQLRLFAHNRGIPWNTFTSKALLIDDNAAVLNMAKNAGLPFIDAVKANKEAAG